MNHIKKTVPRVKANITHYLEQYCCKGETIVELSRLANLPPYQMARLFVEHLTDVPKPHIGHVVMHAMQILDGGQNDDNVRAPVLVIPPAWEVETEYNITARRLAQEVQTAVDMDPLYGPRHDLARRMIGVEFEVVLETQLTQMGTYR